MALDSHAFMTTMEKSVGFSNEDKALLKSNADWGKDIAPTMADHFYEYLGRDSEMDALSRICMSDLALIEQAYVEVSSAAVLRETGWTEGLFKRLVATGASSM